MPHNDVLVIITLYYNSGETVVTSTAPVNNLAPPGIVSDQIHSVHIVVVLLEYGNRLTQ